MAKLILKRLDADDVISRIRDCRGAVHLAIEGILSGDEEKIDAAMGSLCLGERELAKLADDIDRANLTASRNQSL